MKRVVLWWLIIYCACLFAEGATTIFQQKCTYRVKSLIAPVDPMSVVSTLTHTHSFSAGCVGPNGEYYYFDNSYYRLWKFKNGASTPVAGNFNPYASEKGQSFGLGFQATISALNNVTACAVGPGGEIYFTMREYVAIPYQTEQLLTIIFKIFTNGSMVRIAGAREIDWSKGDTNPLAITIETDNLAVAANGDIYFSETNFCVIRKISANTGLVSVVAGTYGVPGNVNSPAEKTQLKKPEALFYDKYTDSLYITDTQNLMIKKLDLTTRLLEDVFTRKSPDTWQFGKGLIKKKSGDIYFTTVYGGQRFVHKLSLGATTSQVVIGSNPGTSKYYLTAIRPDVIGALDVYLDQEIMSLLSVNDNDDVLHITFAGRGIVVKYQGSKLYTEQTSSYIQQVTYNNFTIDKVYFDNGNTYLVTEKAILKIKQGSTTTEPVLLAESSNGEKYFKYEANKVFMAFPSNGDVIVATYDVVRRISTTGTIVIMGGDMKTSCTSTSTNCLDGNIGGTERTLLANKGILLLPNGDLLLIDDNLGRLRVIRSSTGKVEAYTPFDWYCGAQYTSVKCKNDVPVKTNNLGKVFDWTLNPITKEVFLFEMVPGFVIRKIDNSGNIRLVAGSMVYGYCNTLSDECGDGKDPSYIRFQLIKDACNVVIRFSPITNELFVLTNCDGVSNIRKIGSNGIISTVLGPTSKTYVDKTNSYEDFPANNNTLFIVTSMEFSPSGELYMIASMGPNARQKSVAVMDPHSPNPIVKTIIGRPYMNEDKKGPLETTVVGPMAVFKTPKGDIYFNEKYMSRIRKLDAATNQVVTVVDNIKYIDGFLKDDLTIYGIWVKDDDVYFTDGDCLIQKFSGNKLYTVAGVQLRCNGNLVGPTCLFITKTGVIYFCEQGTHKIRKIINGTVTDVAGTGEACTNPPYCGNQITATRAKLNTPSAIYVTENEDVYIADTKSYQIRMVNGTTKIISTIAGTGSQCNSETACKNGGDPLQATLMYPLGITLTDDGTIVFSDRGQIRYIHRNRKKIDAVAGRYSDFGDNIYSLQNDISEAPFAYPAGIFFDGSSLLVADTKNRMIKTIQNVNCPYGYSGFTCVPYCFGVYGTNASTCSSHGECVDYNSCSCDIHYYGEKCSITTCNSTFSNTSLSCNNRGSCFPYETCNCRTNYYGDYCEYTHCFGIESNSSSVCSSHGSCIDFNSCKCDKNYYGQYCNITTCNSTFSNSSETCSSRGTCTLYEKCECRPNYFGKYCENTHCYGIQSNSSSVCSSHGSCIDFDSCKCDKNYYGQYCNITTCNSTFSNSSETCSSRGTCTLYEKCECRSKYFGKYCENTHCYGIQSNSSSVCSSHGSCIDFDSCKCDKNYYENNCSLTTCFGIFGNSSTVCSGHGECVLHDTCKCNPYYHGNNCSINQCYGEFSNSSRVCSGNGVCTRHNNCVCKEYYYGSNCSINTCYGLLSNNSKVCSGHGVCSTFDHCDCEKNYILNNCSLPLCFSIPANDSTVCSGVGECVNANTCKCKESYSGNMCEQFYCNNVSHNSPSVCSGHGNCSAPNACLCSNNYGGENCEIPYCFGLLANSMDTCNGLGNCIAPDTCKCIAAMNNTAFYNGSTCDQLFCFSKNSKDPSSCSGNGNCFLDTETGLGGCNCTRPFFGEQCQNFTCFGKKIYDPTICNGHGKCIGHDTCECLASKKEGFWGGTDCSSCMVGYESVQTGCTTPYCDPVTTCSNHGVCNSTDQCECVGVWEGKYCSLCKQNYYGEQCEIFCSQETQCSNHGYCNSNGTCDCYFDSQKGFYVGSSCNSCGEGYYGRSCLTHIIAVRFLDAYNGLNVSIYGPISSILRIDCSKMIYNTSLLGENPSCYWTNKESGEFTISFGNGYSVLPNDILLFNRLVFDNSNQTDYTPLQVLNAENAVSPVASIMGSNLISSCDPIVLDGSGSYSGDMRMLNYKWSVLSSPDNVLDTSVTLSTSSRIEIPSEVASTPGTYTFSLVVQGSMSGISSLPFNYSVVKSSIPLPTLTIVGLPSSTFFTSSTVIIKKLITFPQCYYQNQSVTVTWEMLSGPKVDSFVDNNQNLVIRKFLKNGAQSYLFSVNVLSQFNPDSVASANITINTISKPLTLSIFSNLITAESVSIIADYLDLEGLDETENWLWTCIDISNSLPCSSSIIQQLQNYSTLKTSEIVVPVTYYSLDIKPTLRISLQITKGSRQASSYVDISIPGAGVSPPTISVISITPQKSYILKQSDIININLDITANNERSNIDQYITREWTLDGVALSSTDPLISKMSKSPSLSNSIVIDPSTLREGTTYTVGLVVKDRRVEQQAQYFTSFTTAKTPQACPCSVSPSAGSVLNTIFTFSCSNCQNAEKSIKITYGFIDDKSLVKMSLYSGDKSYSTKLPSTSSPLTNKNLAIFFKIEDTNSGAYIEQLSSVIIEIPSISISKIVSTTQTWTTYSKSLKDGNPLKLVFNPATISRAVYALYASMKYIRMTSIGYTTCINGSLKDGKCICLQGYFKADCSLSESLYNAFLQMRTDLMESLISDFQNRNEYETISETYLSSQVFALASLVENFDEINHDIFKQSFDMFQRLIELSVANEELVLSKTVSNLILSVLNSFYSYTDYVGSEERINEMKTIMEKISQIVLRGKFVGEMDSIMFTPFQTLVSNKLYSSDLALLSIVSGKSKVILPIQTPKYFTETRKPIAYNLASVSIRNFIENGGELFINSTIGDIKNETRIISKNTIRSSSLGLSIGSLKSMNNTQYVLETNSSISLKEIQISNSTISNNGNTYVESIYRKSIFSCAQYINQTLKTAKDCELVINTPQIICKCNALEFYLLAEEIIERRELIVYPTIIQPNPTTSSSNNEGPIIDSIKPKENDINLIVIVVPILGGTIIIVSVCILIVIGLIVCRKFKSRKSPSNPPMEMRTV